MVKECLVNTHTILYTCVIIFGSMSVVTTQLIWADYQEDHEIDCDI